MRAYPSGHVKPNRIRHTDRSNTKHEYDKFNSILVELEIELFRVQNTLNQFPFGCVEASTNDFSQNLKKEKKN